jgi:hypothetical protein
MKNLFRFFIVVIFIIAGTTIGSQKPKVASPVFSQQLLNNSFSKVKNTSIQSVALTGNVFLDGGNRLASLQYTDGCWGWPLTAPPTYPNLVGPISMGLAQAYQHTGNSAFRSALLNAGAYLLAKTNNFSASDGYLASQLDKIFGVSTYKNYVKSNFYDQLAAGTYNRNGAGTLYI